MIILKEAYWPDGEDVRHMVGSLQAVVLNSETMLTNLEKMMAAVQIAEAQQLARECIAKNFEGC